MNINLTHPQHKTILISLSQKTKVGIGTPLSKGVKTPNQGVFYCLKKMVAPAVRPSILVARSGQPQGWPAPLPGSSNLLRVAAQSLEPLSGGYQPSVKEQPL
ncbi:hypothetical protein [Methylomonas sp. DH-1]|uniref:hypothetical protein n=1 Tax=Methylomonas sp. (strain DH-1) TaxID=1727196 RepID=UPI0007C959FF|nr:hypothetical protein [Methylomonas sp. DH-1]ANE54774.1 hypothetical protein AYM39_05970 [Methylomonas sp. DH-1]